MTRKTISPLWPLVLLFVSCVSVGQGAGQNPPNILFIIGDDMGVDTLSFYGLNDDTASTPNLESLAERGVVFEQFWSQPACTPTRAEILSGRHGFRTGVLRQIGGASDGPKPPAPGVPAGSPAEGRNSPTAEEIGVNGPPNQSWGLGSGEFALPLSLKNRPGTPYTTAAFGKWHLADQRNGWVLNPNQVGFEHFSGPMEGFLASYFAWRENTNGSYADAFGYAPTNKVDAAIEWISGNEDKPWFVWLAFNLPHRPLHAPYPELVNSPELKELDPVADPAANPRPRYKAMIETLDTEIGRLLDGIGEAELQNTYVIFLGDNGSEPDVISAPFRAEGAKNTLYQGGINTPLIISGPGTKQGTRTAGLAKSVDLFETVLNMAGMQLEDTLPAGSLVDTVSLFPYLARPDTESIRAYNYADYLPFSTDTGVYDFAIRNLRYKYIQTANGAELYDLEADPYEQNNLLKAQTYNGWLSPGIDQELLLLRVEADRLRFGVSEAAPVSSGLLPPAGP